MTQITLAKALKLKNRLTSRINQVKKQITAHNGYVVDKNIPVSEIKLQVDVPVCLQDLTKLTNSLVEVKSAINNANANSSGKIFLLSELKGLISFYENLDCDERLVQNFSTKYNVDDIKRVQISLSDKNNLIKELTKKAEFIQDELDEYNATTKIQINDYILEL